MMQATTIMEQGAEREFVIPANTFAETVVEVEHYTDHLFRFRITRPASFRFRSGEFVMIGLPRGDKPVFRAYSIASPAWDDEIEFFSIKVPNGPLTEHLQKIEVGDTILMRQKATGTLVLDALRPGKRLFLISTGTGIAPFASLIRDPETYEKFDRIYLTHTCRDIADLKFGYDVAKLAGEDILVGEEASARLVHFATTTREETAHMGRITTLIENGSLFSTLGIEPLDRESDRVMICGSMGLNLDMKAILEARGFEEGSNSRPADYVVERAFVG